MKKNILKIYSVIISFIVLFFSVSSVGCNAGNKNNGTDSALEIKYYNESSDLLPMLISGKETIGLLPEPAASTLEKKTAGVTWYRLDLQQLYDSEEKAYPQAVLMIKSSVIANYSLAVEAFSDKITENVLWAKSNTETAVQAIKSVYENTSLNAGSMTSAVIDNCKIYFQSAADAKDSVNAYISGIRSIDGASANAVDNAFYYSDGAEDADSLNAEANVPTAKSFSGSDKKLSVYTPDGAPALAVAKFINESYDLDTGADVEYHVVKSDEIAAAMAQAKGDMIIMPVNAATKLYSAGNNQTDPYKLAGVITHGNFYILSREEIMLADLKGKRIGVPNMGKVPDWTFRFVLGKSHISYTVAD